MKFPFASNEESGSAPRSRVRGRLRHVLAGGAAVVIAVLSLAGPASAAPARGDSAADLGYILLCTGSYGTGDCISYVPETSNQVCRATGLSFHSAYSYTSQNQWVYTSGQCRAPGYQRVLYAWGEIGDFPIGSFSHT